MVAEFLDTYLDASGKHSGGKDKLLTVNGCLSTPAKRNEFDTEWQSALKDFQFKPHSKSGRYVFHTTDFKSGYCKLSPTGISNTRKQEIYHALLHIIRKHSLYVFGIAVSLKDYDKFAIEYPFIRKVCFGKPGTFISILGIGKCMEWAGKKGYSKSISLMFDQGDEFWGEMSHEFKHYVKTPANEHLNINTLTCGDKAVYLPLQAADVAAWECRKFFKRLANIKINVAGITHHRELEMLRWPYAYFSLYQYNDIKARILEIYPDAKGDIVGLEQRMKQLDQEREEKLRLKRERRNARKGNQKSRL